MGKSSLVRAGVVASLTRAGTPVLVITPGAHPMDSLSGLKPRGRQTLVVDQAEEAVTVCTDAAERERFFAALAEHVGAGGALVVSLRADHLGDLAPYPSFARVLEEGMYLLGPMSEPELRSAVEGPAGAPVSGSSRVWSTCWSARSRASRPRCRCSRTCCARPGNAARARP